MALKEAVAWKPVSASLCKQPRAKRTCRRDKLRTSDMTVNVTVPQSSVDVFISRPTPIQPYGLSKNKIKIAKEKTAANIYRGRDLDLTSPFRGEACESDPVNARAKIGRRH